MYTRIISTCILLYVVVCVAETEMSSGIRIKDIRADIVEQTFTLNANIIYQLSDESKKALEHGVPLVFDIEFRIIKVRSWLWDELVIKRMIRYRIEHQPLTGHYLVSDNYRGRLHQFSSLPGALEFIGKVEQFPLLDIGLLSPEHEYFAQIKSVLNVQSLPAPLRPLAYFSSDWRLTSPWHNLEIRI